MRDADFSIVITSHNQAAFIREAVDSALGQRRAAKEVIVVDDASSDDSAALLEKYGGKIALVKLPVNRGACRRAECRGFQGKRNVSGFSGR